MSGARRVALVVGASVSRLHRGTVDTALSQPFQRGVPAERLFSPQRAAAQLLDVIDSLSPAQSGSFLARDGTVIPW